MFHYVYGGHKTIPRCASGEPRAYLVQASREPCEPRAGLVRALREARRASREARRASCVPHMGLARV